MSRAMPVTVEAVEAMIRLKLKERIEPGSSLLRTGFRLFGRPENGITVQNFRQTLANLGIILDLADATEIFSKYDTNGNGRINFNEFCLSLFPKDFSGVSWNVRRDQEQWVDRKRKSAALMELQHVGMGMKATSYPLSMQQNRATLDELEKIIQQKIEQRAPRPQVQFMTAYKMFGSPKDGLTPDMFRTNLWRLGIPASQAECNALFNRYDTNHSGSMDFYEFIQGVMPSDYPAKAWTVTRDEQQWQAEAKAAVLFEPIPKEYPKSMMQHQYSTAEIERLLADKLTCAARNDLEKYRKAYYMFGRPKGDITFEVFCEKIKDMGVPAREEQLADMYRRYDVSGQGKMDFYEMVRQILPKDYPAKTWTTIRGEQMQAEEMRRLIEGKKNAVKAKYKPNMSIVRGSRANTAMMAMGMQSPTPRRSPTPRKLKKIPATARSNASRMGASGSGTARSKRPISRALAARANAIERVRLGTARRADK